MSHPRKHATYTNPDGEEVPVRMTEYEAAFDQGAASVGAAFVTRKLDSHPYFLRPDGYTIESMDQWLDEPKRLRGTVNLETAASFIGYVADFRTPGTRIFASRAHSTITAVLDYHAGADDPSWCTHVATLTLKKSKEWETWISFNNKSIPQLAFAEFLEDNHEDINEPDGAVILEAAMSLEAVKTAHFKSANNLANGTVQYQFTETIDGNTQAGKMILPARFILGISPYYGGHPIAIPTKLRYRINDGRLSFTYIIQHADRVLDERFDHFVEQISEALELPSFSGSYKVPA